MADYTRASSFMPTIKCSMCAQEIEISMMGEHVCAPQMPEPMPPMDSRNFQSRPEYKRKPSNGDSLLKPGRLPPPRVDTSAANRPFLRQESLTPVSASSDSRNVSPRTPNDMPRSPYGRRPSQPGRMQAPPSPEILSSNLDNAFPPFPTKKPLPAALNRTNFAREVLAEADPMYAPKSPGLQGTGHLLQRMNSIAPGPFDPNRANRAPSRDGTAKGLQPAPLMNERQEEHVHVHSRTPSLEHSKLSRSSTSSSSRANGSRTIPKLERTNGYGGFGPPASQDDHSQREPMNRAQTFPRDNLGRDDPASYQRRPSEPDIKNRRTPENDIAGHNSNNYGMSPPRERRPSAANTAFPSNQSSNSYGKDHSRLHENLPSSNDSLAADYEVGNPYHTPNLSQSSNDSGRSGASGASSRSSPPSDAGRSRRKPSSDTSDLDALMNNLKAMPAQRVQTSPTKKSPPRLNAQGPISDQWARGIQPPKFGLSPLESPMDPAIQEGRLSPLPPRAGSRPTEARNNASVPTRTPSEKRPTTAKGNCKGCGEAIKGKSVSSADGRLTGRYHKSCFVCKKCSEPFATATFYVLNDSPYCERHYHQLNNSMCKTCDRGIEGQYLQTERGTKHHPHCLTCSDCKVILRNDYFEMSGRVFCERDAMRRSQMQRMGGGSLGVPGQGTNRMERRTTRLMMI